MKKLLILLSFLTIISFSDIQASNVGVEESARVTITNTNITNNKALGLFVEDAGTATAGDVRDANVDPLYTRAAFEGAGNSVCDNTTDPPTNLP